ncbi:hypothetical protein JXA47_12985 [Candidatus Sumerlaeota bacterium]|nr:hypothetical protein [Candidatus Sumerlaeota bacterium]
MSSGGPESPGLAPARTWVRSRLEVLRLPPTLYSALAGSPLGGLPSLWSRLSERERADLTEFERVFRRGQRLELRGDMEGAARIYHLLAHQWPRFRSIALERLGDMGHPAALDFAVEAPPEETTP